jgi:hypothetical protein
VILDLKHTGQCLLGAAAFLLGTEICAAAEIVPRFPLPFEQVNVRMTVDDCAFDASSVGVTQALGTVRVRYRLNNCLVAGHPIIVDIGLGAYPPGSIGVELFSNPGSNVPDETLAFVITDLAQIQISPPPPRPLTDYSGRWWAAGEAGWGLSVHQSPLRTLAASWFVHDASGQPVWFTLQPGNWTDPTTFTGPIYRTTGPFYGGVFNPALVNSQQVGTGTLDFEQRPGTEGNAVLTFTINGTAITRTITRFRF